MYVDKLDGKIDSAFYERVSAAWGKAQIRCLCETDLRPLRPDQGVGIAQK